MAARWLEHSPYVWIRVVYGIAMFVADTAATAECSGGSHDGERNSPTLPETARKSRPCGGRRQTTRYARLEGEEAREATGVW